MSEIADDDEDIAEEMAVGRLAGAGGADRDVASEFLKAKTAFLRKQLHRMRVSHFREWLYVSAEIALGLVILLIFVSIASAVWSAAHDNGLVIESFSVPPDFAARGLNGQVVAAQMLDRLSKMQRETTSNRAMSSYSNNWGSDIKVQIPNTGVSIGDIDRYLRSWLGNETHISGEVYRDGNKVTITARVTGDVASSFTGPLSDFDKLMQQAAEAVYRSTQPYRYAVYLDGHGRQSEAEPIFEQLTQTGSAQDRAWAYVGLSAEDSGAGKLKSADRLLAQAIAIDPDLLLPYSNLANNESSLQHDEAGYQAVRKAVEIAHRGPDTSMNKDDFEFATLQNEGSLAGIEGDLNSTIAYNKKILAIPNRGNSWRNARQSNMVACAQLHDLACVRKAAALYPRPVNANDSLNFRAAYQLVMFGLEDWRRVIAQGQPLLSDMKKVGAAALPFQRRFEYPILARAYAGIGDLKSAHRYIDLSPPDCVQCLRFRGTIAGLEKRPAAADYWFARAVALSKSTPAAYLDWGQSLVRQGAYKRAIEEFRQAVAHSVHYADPLEGWGEALMGDKRSDLALAKFEEAARYAPNWGRLHVKWGEALSWLGRKDEARKQFAVASHLYLTADEKSELDAALGASRT